MESRASGRPNIYFSDYFDITEQELDDYQSVQCFCDVEAAPVVLRLGVFRLQ
jgi:hypothetical protein